jgi:type I restriction enzyme S subunit
MSEWLEKKVKELCIIGRGRVISQDEINSNLGIYPVFSSQTANNGEMGKIESYDFDGEYVTWTTDGANAGTVFYRSGKFNCTNVCGTLKEKEENTLDLRFFSYLLSTEAKKHVSYIGNPKLMNGIMADIKLNLPKDKPEQTRIAEILSTTDEAIAQTEALIAKYQRIKTGLMQDLLTKGIDENGNIRSKETHKFVVKNGIEVPEEWAVDNLGTIINAIDPQPDHRTPAQVENGIPYLGINDVDETGNIDYRKCRKVGINILEEHNNRYQLRVGDIIFGKIGTIGEPKRLINLENITLSANVILIQPIENSDFIYWVLNSENIKHQVNNSIHSTSQPAFGMEKIRALKISIPKPDEQERIGKLLNDAQENIFSTTKQLIKLQSIKIGLMQDLLSGKVRVKPNNKN